MKLNLALIAIFALSTAPAFAKCESEFNLLLRAWGLGQIDHPAKNVNKNVNAKNEIELGKVSPVPKDMLQKEFHSEAELSSAAAKYGLQENDRPYMVGQKAVITSAKNQHQIIRSGYLPTSDSAPFKLKQKEVARITLDDSCNLKSYSVGNFVVSPKACAAIHALNVSNEEMQAEVAKIIGHNAGEDMSGAIDSIRLNCRSNGIVARFLPESSSRVPAQSNPDSHTGPARSAH